MVAFYDVFKVEAVVELLLSMTVFTLKHVLENNHSTTASTSNTPQKMIAFYDVFEVEVVVELLLFYDGFLGKNHRRCCIGPLTSTIVVN